MGRCALALAGALLLSAAGLAGQSRGAGKPAPDVQKALREGGLHAAAIAAGGTYRAPDQPAAQTPVADLKSLVAMSETIAIGETVETEVHLADHDQAIATDCRMQVIELPRGTHAPGDVIVLRVPGGRIEFRDGAVAEMSSSGYPTVHNGRRLVMFLRRVPSADLSPAASNYARGTTVYAPAAGPVSLMPSAPDGTIDFEGRRDPIARAYRTKSAKTFMEDLRGLLKSK